MTMRNRQGGFTLIELILVILVCGILSTFASRYIAAALKSFLDAQNVTDTTWQARLAYIRLLRDCRQIRSPADITTFTSSEINFTDMTGATFDYVFSGTTLSLNGQVMADGIAGSFGYYDININTASTAAAIKYITFNFTNSQKGANYSFSGTAETRNSAS